MTWRRELPPSAVRGRGQRARTQDRQAIEAKDLPRLKRPRYDVDKLKTAIAEASRWDSGRWAATEHVAGRLGVSRGAAYRWLCDAAARGMIETRVTHAWRHSKSVAARRWRVTS